jgi:hypothetical protein
VTTLSGTPSGLSGRRCQPELRKSTNAWCSARIYLTGLNGTVTVLKAGQETPEVVAKNRPLGACRRRRRVQGRVKSRQTDPTAILHGARPRYPAVAALAVLTFLTIRRQPRSPVAFATWPAVGRGLLLGTAQTTQLL